MSNMIVKLALALMLAVSPAALYAQTQQSETPKLEQSETEKSADAVPENSEATPADDQQQPADTAVKPAEGTTEEAQAEEGTPAEGTPVEGQIVLQSENTVLGNDMIGATVFSANDESIGEINDLIVALNGNVEGAVIGVGGFLGIGEKDVAVEMAKFSVNADQEGNVRLVLNSTKEELEAAPEFKSVATQKRAERLEQAQEEQQQLQQQATGGVQQPAPNE